MLYLWPDYIILDSKGLGNIEIDTCTGINIIWHGGDKSNHDFAARVRWRRDRTNLTQWSRVTYAYVNKLTTIGSDNDLSPARWQAII